MPALPSTNHAKYDYGEIMEVFTSRENPQEPAQETKRF